ncbi:hypothetical protein BJX64DRAFT_295142 [Aspergillus heterothallicus]
MNGTLKRQAVPSARAAAIRKHQASITTAAESSSAGDTASGFLPAQNARLNRRDPSTVTTAYTIDQTTIIIIDPSPSMQGSSTDGTQTATQTNTDAAPAQSTGSTHLGEEVGTATAGSGAPEAETNTSTTNIQDPASTTTTKPAESTTALNSTPGSQNSGSTDVPPSPTSTVWDPTQNHDTLTTIDTPQEITSTPSGSETSTGTTSDVDVVNSGSSSGTQEPGTGAPSLGATSLTGVLVGDPTDTTPPVSSTPNGPRPSPPTTMVDGPVLTPGSTSSGTQTLPDVETIPGIIGGTIFSSGPGQSPLPTGNNLSSSTNSLGPIGLTSTTAGTSQTEPVPSITTVFVTTILESGTSTEALITLITPAPETSTTLPLSPDSLVLSSVASISSRKHAQQSRRPQRRDYGFIIGLEGGLNTGGGGGGGGSSHGYGANKRKRGIFDFATDIIQTAFDTFTCIDDVVEDLAGNIDANLPGPIPGLRDDLTNLLNGLTTGSNGEDEDENSTTLSPITSTVNSEEPTLTQTTSETTSSCSETTALQDTVTFNDRHRDRLLGYTYNYDHHKGSYMSTEDNISMHPNYRTTSHSCLRTAISHPGWNDYHFDYLLPINYTYSNWLLCNSYHHDCDKRSDLPTKDDDYLCKDHCT